MVGSRLAIQAAMLASLSGCISTISVKHIDPASDARGLRFQLPVTLLMVQPQADGSASYTWVYPGDRSKTYAIVQHNFLSKFNLDVTVANNLLSKANSQQDSTTLPAKLMDSFQSAFAAHEAAGATDKKAGAAAQTAAITAMGAADLALKQAKDQQTILAAKGSTDQKLAAELKVSDAQAAADAALAAYTKLTSAGDVPGGPTSSQQWGPAFFALVQADSAVAGGAKRYRLQQVNVQVQMDTVIPAVAPTGAGGAAPTLVADQPTYDHSKKPLVVNITVTPAPGAVDKSSSVVEKKTLRQVTPAPSFALSGGKLVVTFAGGLPASDYVISPAIGPVGGPFASPATLTISVK